MSRRQCALSSLMGMMARDIRESMLGKIRKNTNAGCGWTLSDKGYTNPQGVYFKPYLDEAGRTISCAKGIYVSNCPKPPKGHDVTPLVRGGYSVKNTECLKCPHHLPKNCCAILRERNSNRKPANELRQVVTDAANLAMEIIKQ